MIIGVLVPIDPDAPAPPPEERPVGRAALALASEGIDVIFGDQLDDGWLVGVRARPGRWERARARPGALHDRYPSQRRAARYRHMLSQCDGVPVGNPERLTLLCRDKAACQDHIAAALTSAGFPPPPYEARPARFESCLSTWGAGFLKPRFGALGTSVQRVVLGDALPALLPGVVPGAIDPAILQRAVDPPTGWAGISVRVLCQRAPSGEWFQNPGVARRSRVDPVVNAARGADVAPADDVLPSACLEQISRACVATCEALSNGEEGLLAVELGVDLVLDVDHLPHVIEVNSRPRGRLEVLAELQPGRFADAHTEACARPLRRLAALAG